MTLGNASRGLDYVCDAATIGSVLFFLTTDTCNWLQVRESACDGLCEKNTSDFCFTSDWLRKWRGFLYPITDRRKLEPKQKQIAFFNSTQNRKPL